MNTPSKLDPSRTLGVSGDTVVGFAILGCMIAGGVGILKASEMDNGFGVFLCLLASVAAFATVYYIYCGKPS